MKLRNGVLFGLLLVASGCATMESGAAFDVGAARGFEEGVATRAQVEATLGAPTQVTSNADGTTLIVYTHLVSKGTAFGGAQAQGNTAAFLFGQDGVLRQKTLMQPSAQTR